MSWVQSSPSSLQNQSFGGTLAKWWTRASIVWIIMHISYFSPRLNTSHKSMQADVNFGTGFVLAVNLQNNLSLVYRKATSIYAWISELQPLFFVRIFLFLCILLWMLSISIWNLKYLFRYKLHMANKKTF